MLAAEIKTLSKRRKKSFSFSLMQIVVALMLAASRACIPGRNPKVHFFNVPFRGRSFGKPIKGRL
jgi:hypothetical protein